MTLLSLFTVYGARQRPNLAIHEFARLIRARRPIPVFGTGTTARNYTYIPNIPAGVMACTEQKFRYEIWNLGESQTVTLNRLIEPLAAAIGRNALVERHPLQPGDVPIARADISKARRLLGYNPSVKIERGLPLFVEWFKNT